MTKKLINRNLSAASSLNRAPVALGPGVFRVSAAEGSEEGEVFIYGDIGGWWGGVSAEQFAKDIAALDVDTLNVRLNSPGGLVFDGVAIYNSLAQHKANVVVHIEGLAASIASVIAMAGDEIRIAEGSRIMIHDPWSIVAGASSDLRAEADILDGLKSDLIDIYAARTEQSRDDLSQWMSDETWLSAREAVDKDFADAMTPAKKKRKESENAHDKSAMFAYFRHAPSDAESSLDLGDNRVQTVREFESFLRDVERIPKAQAKRIIASAREITAQPEGVRSPRWDAEAAQAGQLAEFIRGLRG